MFLFFFCLEIINGKNGQRANRDEITEPSTCSSNNPASSEFVSFSANNFLIRSCLWESRAQSEEDKNPTFSHSPPSTICPHTRTHTPCIDLQCGLQYLGSLLSSAGQLLGAEEVACGAHFQHCDHGRVGVQTRRQLKCQRRKLTTAHGGNKETFKSVSQGA